MKDNLLIVIVGGIIASVAGWWIVSKLSTGTPGAAQASSGGNAYAGLRVTGGGYIPAFTGTQRQQRDIYTTQPTQLQGLSQ